MTKIKICGLTRPEDIDMVNELQPDYIGFVFAKSRRRVSLTQAQSLKSRLSNEIKAVGVFVNEKLETIAEIAALKIIDLIQLHGDEDADYCRQLRRVTNLPIIKAVRVKDENDIEGIEKYNCDYDLFDTLSATHYGGTGTAFDHSILHNKKIKKPFFIAGGINSNNIGTVIKTLKPYGVDVSGGVETDGLKDFAKIEDFIKQGRIVEKNE